MPDELNMIYSTLFDAFGPQKWWPGESRFEIMVGAILTQNTNWSNVEKAIENLKAANCLSPEKLFHMDTARLAELIRPSGYFRIKSKRLKNFLGWLFENHDGDPGLLDTVDTDTLRRELLAVKGIGSETADSILLYALKREVFVIDGYTARIASRHGLIESDADYYQIQEFFISNLPVDMQLYNEFHALLVMVGKNFCKPNPKCNNCPLNKFPHNVEIEF